ncbi:MAG: ATP-binding protein, partial [Treponema sp.]|nr:ATP-binding protein [Treponema sp.]
DALFGDTVRIRQVLLNLLSNAVKYTEKGFVSLSIYGKMASNNIVCLTIEVTDSGKGIKPEEMKNLFSEFIRLDQVNNKGIEGTGLGLAITRNLVKAMGGEINARSEYGKGSTFIISLPQEIRSGQKLAEVNNPEEKNVLIYERREIYINSIVNTMKNLGVNYKLVSTSPEFYDCLLSKKYPFVFLSSTLYEQVKKENPGLKSGAKFALIAEFGEVVAERSISIITAPVFSVPVANFLNGVSSLIGSSSGAGAIMKFIMPDAKILVVDDINSNLKVAAGLLLPYRAEVKLCKSGMESIEVIKSARFDVVFMDHMMPDMDGIEALSLIREMGREDPYYKNVAVVALTADAVLGTREMLLEKGFNDFLSKPIDMLKLNAILERWIPKEKQKALNDNNTPEAAVSANNSDIKIVISGLDVNRGLALTGGTMKNYIEILHSFYGDGIEKIKQLKECLETGNLPLYVIYVHALKSASAIIGAEKLSKAAEELENAGRQGDSVFIQANSAVLTNDLEILLHEISAVLSREAEETKTCFADKELLINELSALKTALVAYNSLEINRATDFLSGFTQAADIGDSIRKILEKKLIGEYEEAVSMIDTLVQSFYLS